MNDVFIALGSNLNNRLDFLNRAVKSLAVETRIRSVANLYESAAYGFTEQPSFLNSALRIETELSPLELLEKIKQIERDLGRIQRHRWGPREIDLDIVFFNQEIIETEALTVPHPDFQNRRFVLLPLAEIAPDFVSPAHQLTLSELLNKCQDSTEIQLVARKWYPDGIKL